MEFLENLFHAYQIPPMCFLALSMNLPLSKDFLLGCPYARTHYFYDHHHIKQNKAKTHGTMILLPESTTREQTYRKIDSQVGQTSTLFKPATLVCSWSLYRE